MVTCWIDVISDDGEAVILVRCDSFSLIVIYLVTLVAVLKRWYYGSNSSTFRGCYSGGSGGVGCNNGKLIVVVFVKLMVGVLIVISIVIEVINLYT